jgi:proline dehydrogenase
MIRTGLLWASRSPWLAKTLPRRRFVKSAVRRFMPGEERKDALGAAKDLQEKGIGAVITLLGENVRSPDEVRAVVEEYRAILTEIEYGGLDAQISVKPTQLGLDLGEEVALEHLLDLVAKAREMGSLVWIDMEDSSYREATIRLFSRCVEKADFSEVGLCLQAYLRSSPQDLQDLLPLSPIIRFVKGAYAESPEVAFPKRKDVDEAFFRLGTRMLEEGEMVALATHDSVLVERLREWVRGRPVGPKRHEIQMLYGIRVEEQLRLAREGEAVRILISYGPAWFPWYMRRLAERPANVWFVLKNLFRG